MSSLWTPYGEHQPSEQEQPPPGGPGLPAEPGEAAGAAPGGPDLDAEQLAELQARLAATPATDLVANHAIGLFELVRLHLSFADAACRADDPRGPEAAQHHLAEAQLALDGFGALVEGLGARLGPHAEVLQDALAQGRLAYVQVADVVVAGPGPAADTSQPSG